MDFFLIDSFPVSVPRVDWISETTEGGVTADTAKVCSPLSFLPDRETRTDKE